MIWFFRRGNLQVDIEVRRLGDGAAFELVVDYPDGAEGIERFTNPRKLVRRTLSLQRRLIREGWIPCGPGMRFTLNPAAAHAPAKTPRGAPAVGVCSPSRRGAPRRDLRPLSSRQRADAW